MITNISKIQWLDTLRTLATLGVIIIHISSPLVNMEYNKNMSFWWIGNVVDSAVRYAVPLFLMLSGATLLDKEFQLWDFYKRRFLRVLVPFLFWIIAYSTYRWAMLLPKFQPQDLSGILHWVVNLFLKEGISKHFWYIYMILAIYLFVPFIGISLQKINKSLILFMLLGWIILCFALRSVSLNLYSWSGNYGSKFFGFFLFTGYLVLGYYLNKFIVSSKKIRIIAAVVFILSIISSAVSTYFFSKNAHKLDLSIYSYSLLTDK